MKRLTPIAAALALAALPEAALAHVGAGDTHGFAHGFLHPLGGLDHLVAMVLVGIFAFQLGGRALWLVPASFVTLMALGGAAGMAGWDLPFVEAGIALSAIVLGIAVAFRVRAPVAAATAVVGLFAVFHGHAHGAEMPAGAAALGYAAGFAAATALLHALGIGLGLVIARAGAPAYRIVGGLASVTGVAILFGLV